MNKKDVNIFKDKDLDQMVFVTEPIDIKLNKEIPKVNQYNTNLCWFTSLTSFFLYKNNKDIDVKKINISISYVLYWLYVEKFSKMFDIIDYYRTKDFKLICDIIDRGIDETGNLDDFKNLVRKHGIVCESDMRSTWFAKNPSQINLLLTRYARKQLIRYFKTNDGNIRKVSIISVQKFLTKCLGVPPTTVKNNYSVNKCKIGYISPVEFAQKLFEGFENYEQVISVESKDFKFSYCYIDKSGRKVYNVSFKKLKCLIDQQYKNDGLVVLGVDCRYGVDYKNKVFTYNPKLYVDALGLDIMPDRKFGFDTMALKINHNLIMAEDYIQGHKKYKICYDSFFGDNVCFMQEEWFDNYVFEAIVNKKFLTKEKFGEKNLIITSNF